MKKVLLFQLGIALISFSAKATIHIVQVANYQFSPSNVPDVIVGDTMRWVWVSGGHTTTANPVSQPGTTLPVGAPTWNAAINNLTPTFDYKVTVAGTYNYWCIPHAPDMAASFTASNALPVTLSSFTVNAVNATAVISWKTLTEQNTDYFSVRRSADGAAFAEIAKLPAAGNSTIEKSYLFTDRTINSDQYYYYNLATVDKDGKRQFSETKLVKGNSAVSKLVLSISPNPITSPGHLMLSFNAAKEGKMEVNVVNAQGQVITKTQMQAFKGINNGHIHLGNLPAGSYTLICLLDGVKETHQVIFK